MAGDAMSRPLGDLCSFINRGSAPAYTDRDGTLVINQRCIRNHRVDFSSTRLTDQNRKPISVERLLQPNDIVVNSTGVGTLGRVAQVRALQERATVDSHVTIVRPDPKEVDPVFLGYCLRYREAEIENLAEGSTGQTELSRSNLAALQVDLPDIGSQHAIGVIGSTLDDKLDLNRRMAATLEDMARALFRSWFVDFDPVHAKAEGRDTGIPADIAALFPTGFNDEGLPLGWMRKRADEIARSVRSMANPQLMPPESPYVGLEHLPRKSLGIANHGQAKQVESGKLYFKAGDLLFGKLRPYFHKVSVMPFEGIASSDIFVFRAKLGKYRGLMYFGFSDEKFVASASGASTGTRMPRAEWSHMSEQQFATDDGQVLEVFNELALSHVSQISERLEECRKLEQLRDTLLPKLLSGELRVTDAESAIAAA